MSIWKLYSHFANAIQDSLLCPVEPHQIHTANISKRRFLNPHLLFVQETAFWLIYLSCVSLSWCLCLLQLFIQGASNDTSFGKVKPRCNIAVSARPNCTLSPNCPRWMAFQQQKRRTTADSQSVFVSLSP
jgi:hypothetical protein